MAEPMDDTDQVSVWIDQDLCTGDGLCVQYAPEVFELDVDGLAYVKTGDELLTSPGARTNVPEHLKQDVIDAAKDCPGECIFIEHCGDRVLVATSAADSDRPLADQ